MWQTDTCYFPYITEEGKSHKVYAICIIDDHSRHIVGSKLFYNDSAANFQKMFKDAVATYGTPTKLYADNGAPYANEQLALICGTIGTVLLHTKVRDGASKGKIERFWLTTKERWLYGLDMDSIHSLEQSNELFKEYIRSYNTTVHQGIGCTPFDRYQASKDSTVPIDKASYDAPMQFIDQKVEIRFRPGEMDSAVT